MFRFDLTSRKERRLSPVYHRAQVRVPSVRQSLGKQLGVGVQQRDRPVGRRVRPGSPALIQQRGGGE